jgi:DNA-3-methyladenine glycosylase
VPDHVDLPLLLARPAIEVAPLVLGGILTHDTPSGSVSLRITELEAYLGAHDPGSHAFRGKGKRNAVMFGPPAHLYTYFTYGMHVCANIVCSPEGTASGLLVRAGEVVDGMDLARERRGAHVPDRDLARGPARLTVALGIALSDGGRSLTVPPYTLTVPEDPVEHLTGPRVGVSGAGGSSEYAWRFWIPGDRTVSPYRRHKLAGP